MTPWMSESEIKKIEEYLDINHTLFEWGSGGSTLHFSKLVNNYISIEYDINWFNYISSLIDKNQINNINYIYCKPDNDIELPIGTSKSKMKDFISYVNIVDTLPNIKYDAVIIDGRSRVLCSKKILPYLHSESVVFVHDFFARLKYHTILDSYNLIDAIYTGQSLAVFKKK